MTYSINRGCLLVFFLLLACSSVAFAAPVTDTIAKKVGAAFLTAQDGIQRSASEARNAQGYENHSIAKVTELRSDGTRDILAYVFALEPRGFVVVSPDTGITPIIAYSFEGAFNWDNSANNVILDMLTQDMRNRLNTLSARSQDLRDRNYELWAKYFSEDRGFLDEMTQGATSGPLLSTAWHQSSPYNAYCPMDPVTGDRSIVGCVATAMAQIVNYHACTTSVAFTSADNYTTNTRGIRVTASNANMSGITYPASPETAGSLSFACGVSVEMDYTSSLSLSVTQHAATAFTDKFGFTEATAYAPSEYYSIPVLPTFYEKLQGNMEAGKPAILAIAKSNGDGHAIVCDGYNSDTGQYHLNYGWGSSSPTPPWWYALPTGMPSGYSVVLYGVLDVTMTACGTTTTTTTSMTTTTPTSTSTTSSTTTTLQDPCNNCNGVDVELLGVTFPPTANCDCTATRSMIIGSGVVIEDGAKVNFRAPEISVHPDFRARTGSSVSFGQ